MGRIRNTIDLAKASWNVLKADKELMVLPLLSFLFTIVVLIVVVVPVLFIGNDLSEGTSELDPGPLGYVLLIIAGLAATFITVFFNAAVVSGANERLTGGDPTVKSSINGAMSRIHRLLPWAIIVATVNLILQAIEERAGALGRFVIGLIGMAWRVVTFLVVPILVLENIGPVDAVKRSASLFKKTWGENLAGQVGFGLLGFVAVLGRRRR